jgi:hypothetical protein
MVEIKVLTEVLLVVEMAQLMVVEVAVEVWRVEVQ